MVRRSMQRGRAAHQPRVCGAMQDVQLQTVAVMPHQAHVTATSCAYKVPCFWWCAAVARYTLIRFTTTFGTRANGVWLERKLQ